MRPAAACSVEAQKHERKRGDNAANKKTKSRENEFHFTWVCSLDKSTFFSTYHCGLVDEWNVSQRKKQLTVLENTCTSSLMFMSLDYRMSSHVPSARFSVLRVKMCFLLFGNGQKIVKMVFWWFSHVSRRLLCFKLISLPLVWHSDDLDFLLRLTPAVVNLDSMTKLTHQAAITTQYH